MQRKLEDSSSNSHSALVEAGREGLALDFERSEPSRRLRLVLRELLRIMNKVIVIYASCLSGKFDLVRNSFHPVITVLFHLFEEWVPNFNWIKKFSGLKFMSGKDIN